MKNLWILGIILILPFVSANHIEYTIFQDKVLVEIETLTGEINSLDLPEEYEISEGQIKYIDPALVQKSGGERFFVSKSSNYEGREVVVNLPEGSHLNKDYFIFPKEYLTTSDGQTITVSWGNFSGEEILIPYVVFVKKSFWDYVFVGLFLLALILFLVKHKRVKKENYTKNLFRDEKRIMNYLLKKGDSWTKEISRDLGIPKVRLSRKLRKLNERGLIKKIPYGNENKISLKRS